MSSNNSVIRVGRKGLKKFAFGEDGPVFEVDVVVAFQEWIGIDKSFRQDEGDGVILTADMPAYHLAAVEYTKKLSSGDVTTAESLDFIARLREQYDELVVFFQPRSRERLDLPDTSEAASALRFSTEES